MKWMFMLLCLVLVGCAAQPITIANTEEAWQDYGQQQALAGNRMRSEQKLSELDQSGPFTAELYQAYQAGYAVGKELYCGQSAYMAAKSGRPYQGICDDVNPFFRSDYDNAMSDSW